MSTLHKFKAYFGMVPLADYEDDYLDEPDTHRGSRGRDPYADDDRGDREFAKPSFSSRRPSRAELDDIDDEYDDYEAPRQAPTLAPIGGRSSRPTSSVGRGAATRGNLAVDTRMDVRAETRRSPVVDDQSALSKITTLRPRDYSEARTIGERFRDGTPVIMDLVEMSNADAKRLVDFAAGLAFALRGSFDKVATKVFLLSPADIDVSPQERRRIAETGFYSQH
ncbi:cell division protein SepF [Rhodococcus sp. BP-252]|uniref:cell division protein SepF n=1 Tax=unclassified Rhodococcus (in: high G+C Gram-positive bacteria) TaxID=192944 RepID=UPI001C9B6734|nr:MULTISPECIES: cell division protein SepF [unclassified Rhodococcus (in: high G+C Gram-positive bacteria)]MBY6411346.1 cell division protein SepF [Rhodococcus sp. BP-320]MBY6416005.1 cell division protein SepF [Rhodococcus sp. BP-321]MBY6420486.1 cell division protein SepF [Rhodococcus sp. BP-324]MBY6426212.1 cell division protein SepF [Rhodococcus sp. BP-323]MBY6431247.1 cell division protein SepF [Rhodococcus sp. BP-322]